MQKEPIKKHIQISLKYEGRIISHYCIYGQRYLGEIENEDIVLHETRIGFC
jgi:hypothetical protein